MATQFLYTDKAPDTETMSVTRLLVCSVVMVWILAPASSVGQVVPAEETDDNPLTDNRLIDNPVTDDPLSDNPPDENPNNGGPGGNSGGDPDDCGCVSGEMQVEEETKGVVRVSELSEGDVILGIMGPEQKPAWCKVEAVFPAASGRNTITHDGFTADHLVVNRTVYPHGYKGVLRNGPIFTLFTECDASVNAAGEVFTPISTAFCPHELGWYEYLSLAAAIRRVVNRTGNFWFDMSAYHDNDTAMVPHWFDQLHQICHELLRCARQDRCQRFEAVMEEFVRDHLNKKYVKVVKREFPNMGGDVNKHQAGTITEVVRSQHEGSHLIVFVTLGSAMVVLMIIAVGILLYHTRMTKKKAEKEPPFESDEKHPQA